LSVRSSQVVFPDPGLLTQLVTKTLSEANFSRKVRARVSFALRIFVRTWRILGVLGSSVLLEGEASFIIMLLVLVVLGFVVFQGAIIALRVLDPVNRHFLNGIEDA